MDQKSNSQHITVETLIHAPIDRVWNLWTTPEHIQNWNFASEEWCCPAAENDLQPGGRFNWRMEAKDGSMGFDFYGTYEQIINHDLITYKIADGRMVKIKFSINGSEVNIKETFEVEGTHTVDQQRAGWQAILNNFKRYVESQ